MRRFCLSLKVDGNFCNSSLWCCMLVNFIFLLIFFALLLVANCGCWLLIFVGKFFYSMVENLYSFCAGSENIEIQMLPWTEGHPFLSVSEKLIASMNSVLMTPTNCWSCLLMISIVLMKYIGLCLNDFMFICLYWA